MTRQVVPLRELWEPVEDSVKELEVYEVSTLGRVRKIKTKRIITPVAGSLREYKPSVRLHANKLRYQRSIRLLVTAVFGESHAAVAVSAVLGLDRLLIDRDELVDRLEQFDEAIGILASKSSKSVHTRLPKRPQTMRDYAMVEAAELGESIRRFLDVDPDLNMTRGEKITRLCRLRASYGPMIEEVAQVPLVTSPPFLRVCTAQ